MTAPRPKRPARPAPTVAPLILLDYDGAAQVSGLRPSYIKRLCDQGRLGYVIDEFYRGFRRRRVRRVMLSDLTAYLLRRYVPPTAQRPPTRRRHGASAK